MTRDQGHAAELAPRRPRATVVRGKSAIGHRQSEIRLLRSVDEVRAFLRPLRNAGQVVGFVPTMGALHKGHLSLMRRARGECDIVVISIFVNPTQFGPHEDLERYPRDPEGDARLAAEAGVDAIFAPTTAEMYPEDSVSYVEQSGAAFERLEGEFRPGHFRGVLTVCLKLFSIVQPDRAYFGQKDYQQSLVVRRMVRDLHLPLEIVVCPTIREPDGLAMSSRNQYLDGAARRQAACIHRGLERAHEAFAAGERSAAVLAKLIRSGIESAGPCEIDYVDIADADTLAPVESVDRPCVAVVAVHIAGTRLIDNCLLEP